MRLLIYTLCFFLGANLSCLTSSDCPSNQYCKKGLSFTCVNKAQENQPCQQDHECLFNNCKRNICYMTNRALGMSCIDSSDCFSTFYCDSSNGTSTCQNRKSPYDSCTKSETCPNNYLCIDNQCQPDPSRNTKLKAGAIAAIVICTFLVVCVCLPLLILWKLGYGFAKCLNKRVFPEKKSSGFALSIVEPAQPVYYNHPAAPPPAYNPNYYHK